MGSVTSFLVTAGPVLQHRALALLSPQPKVSPAYKFLKTMPLRGSQAGPPRLL